jgi:hypothetical protein
VIIGERGKMFEAHLDENKNKRVVENVVNLFVELLVLIFHECEL